MNQQNDSADFEFLDDDDLTAIRDALPSMQYCEACGTEFSSTESICPLCELSTLPTPEPSQDILPEQSNLKVIAHPKINANPFSIETQSFERELEQMRRDSMMICPHCLTQGQISTDSDTKKTGVSGTKLAAAILTGGWSILAVGLSKKDSMIRAFCSNCGAEWHIH